MGKTSFQYTTGAVAPAYDMARPNDGAPDRGMLAGLCLAGEKNKKGAPPWVFSAPGRDTWIDAELLEEMMDADPSLRRACKATLASLPARPRGKDPEQLAGHEARMRKAIRAIAGHVGRVFEEKMLVEIIQRFEPVKSMVAEYMLAKEAVRAARPAKFPEPPAGDEGDDDDD